MLHSRATSGRSECRRSGSKRRGQICLTDTIPMNREMSVAAGRPAAPRLPSTKAGWITAREPERSSAIQPVEDIGHGLDFLSRLLDPYDAESSPQGDAAWDKVLRAGKGVVDYTTNAISNPKV